MRLYFYFTLILQTFTFGANPHPVPKLKDLKKPWVFARANEASLLFIEPQHKNSEPYAHIIQSGEKLQWFEFNGKDALIWDVTRFTETDKELTLYLKGGNKVGYRFSHNKILPKRVTILHALQSLTNILNRCLTRRPKNIYPMITVFS